VRDARPRPGRIPEGAPRAAGGGVGLRRKTILIVSMLCIAGLVGLAAGAPPETPHVKPTLEFAASEAALEQGAVSNDFDFSALRDLWIRVRVPKLSPTTEIDLAFITPGGEIFYETTRYFSRVPQAATTRVPGRDHPVTAMPARRIRGGYTLDMPVPVAGSVFTRYPAPGGWTVRARLVESGQSLSAPVAIRFTP